MSTQLTIILQHTTTLEDLDHKEWDAFIENTNTSYYLRTAYLKSLAETLKNEVSYVYVTGRNSKNQLVFVAALQVLPFVYKGKELAPNFRKIVTTNAKGKPEISVIVCGNVFATGETGFSYDATKISKSKTLHQIAIVIQQIQAKNDNLAQPLKINTTLFKEFYPGSLPETDVLLNYNYQSFQIDVIMEIELASHWQTLQDYSADLKAKYRTKMNSVFYKSRSLRITSLSSDEILRYQKNIDKLFKNVLEQSNYQAGVMTAACFAALKKYLPTIFDLRAAFLGDELVGFSTSFKNDKILDANYVGINYTYNTTHAIYQRLLYDYIERGILFQVAHINLGRTSELLKSSLGATPVAMHLYAKHRSKIKNIVLSTILKNITASPFELRKPFKANFYSTTPS